jgi:hypothetical protein
MRTAHRVMIVVLLAACYPALAQNAGGGAVDSLDRDITVVGRDETAVAVPQPWKEDAIRIPDIDPAPLGASLVPAILPPAGDWPVSGYNPGDVDPMGENLS